MPEVVPPAWSVLPFAVYLLSIALVPLFAHRFWESNRNKFAVAVVASLPVLVYLLALEPHHGPHWLLHSAKEYVAFIVLLGALFVISGGVYLRGSLAGTPLVNTGVLGLGALLASFIGTTGASVPCKIFIIPGLNACTCPVRVMPPSGKMQTSSPLLSASRAVRRALAIDLGLGSIKIVPCRPA